MQDSCTTMVSNILFQFINHLHLFTCSVIHVTPYRITLGIVHITNKIQYSFIKRQVDPRGVEFLNYIKTLPLTAILRSMKFTLTHFPMNSSMEDITTDCSLLWGSGRYFYKFVNILLREVSRLWEAHDWGKSKFV